MSDHSSGFVAASVGSPSCVGARQAFACFNDVPETVCEFAGLREAFAIYEALPNGSGSLKST